jgi:hypothetical protein
VGPADVIEKSRIIESRVITHHKFSKTMLEKHWIGRITEDLFSPEDEIA